MKAIVQKDFEFENIQFKQGEEYETKAVDWVDGMKGVFVNGEWFCDVGSPLYNKHFLSTEIDEKQAIDLIRKASNTMLNTEELSDNETNILLSLINMDYTITFK